MSENSMYEAARRSGLPGYISKRRVEKCSGDYWYKELIGKTVEIVQYGTFGCFDKEGRWYYFYDLSNVIE